MMQARTIKQMNRNLKFVDKIPTCDICGKNIKGFVCLNHGKFFCLNCHLINEDKLSLIK